MTKAPPDVLEALREEIRQQEQEEKEEDLETHRYDVPGESKKRPEVKNPEDIDLEDKEQNHGRDYLE